MNIRANPLNVLATTAIAAGLALSVGCASTSTGYGSNNNYYGSSNSNCYDCGTVTRIEGGGNGKAGALIGGIIGAVAGHEVSAHTGGSTGNQNVSALAGAAAGAAAGNAIAKNRIDSGYVVHVRMNDGRTTTIRQDSLGNIREGSRVRISNGRAYLQ